MNEIVKKQTAVNKPETMIRSELIATLDRLLYELHTGDCSHRPTRMWRILGLHDSLRTHGWPYIESVIINLNTLAFSASHWPLTIHSHQSYFVQIASLRYHYGLAIVDSRQFLLSAFITPYHRISLFQGCLQSVNTIIQSVMMPEIHSFLQNGFTILIRNRFHKPLDVNQETCLKKMSNLIDDWKNKSKELLSFR
jgi:hypothetical protein